MGETISDNLGVKKAVSSERKRRGGYRVKEGGVALER